MVGGKLQKFALWSDIGVFEKIGLLSSNGIHIGDPLYIAWIWDYLWALLVSDISLAIATTLSCLSLTIWLPSDLWRSLYFPGDLVLIEVSFSFFWGFLSIYNCGKLVTWSFQIVILMHFSRGLFNAMSLWMIHMPQALTVFLYYFVSFDHQPYKLMAPPWRKNILSWITEQLVLVDTWIILHWYSL